MKKMKKKRSFRENSVQAYACVCACSCSCACNLFQGGISNEISNRMSSNANTASLTALLN